MSNFTDEDRRQEMERRQRKASITTVPLTTKCIHCGLSFASYLATDDENPICPVCL